MNYNLHGEGGNNFQITGDNNNITICSNKENNLTEQTQKDNPQFESKKTSSGLATYILIGSTAIAGVLVWTPLLAVAGVMLLTYEGLSMLEKKESSEQNYIEDYLGSQAYRLNSDGSKTLLTFDEAGNEVDSKRENTYLEVQEAVKLLEKKHNDLLDQMILLDKQSKEYKASHRLLGMIGEAYKKTQESGVVDTTIVDSILLEKKSTSMF